MDFSASYIRGWREEATKAGSKMPAMVENIRASHPITDLDKIPQPARPNAGQPSVLTMAPLLSLSSSLGTSSSVHVATFRRSQSKYSIQ